MVKVDKGITMPRKHSGRPCKYPWCTMHVGDSFFITTNQKRISNTVKGTAAYAPKRFSQRKVAGGFRVWRVK